MVIASSRGQPHRALFMNQQLDKTKSVQLLIQLSWVSESRHIQKKTVKNDFCLYFSYVSTLD